MTFAWYGFSIEHPEDWAPVTITGARKEGYVRIASPGRQSLQVRWKEGENSNLRSVLDTYIERLSADARKAKTPFKSQVDESDSRLTYRYAAASNGRGAIFHSAECGRVFFLEAISSKSDSLLPTFRALLDSFKAADGYERWALYGLSLRLPKGLQVDRKVLLAGRTQIELSHRKAKVEAERWGFAEQLVAKHGLESWARSVLELPSAVATISEDGIRLEQGGTTLRAPVYAIARIQPDRNQISTVKVTTRDEAWRPAWDWFD